MTENQSKNSYQPIQDGAVGQTTATSWFINFEMNELFTIELIKTFLNIKSISPTSSLPTAYPTTLEIKFI